MLNPRKNTKRKAPDETGFDHPVVFPRRLRAACFSAIGVTTAVALIIVGLFANVGLSFLPVPGLALPSGPTSVPFPNAFSVLGQDSGVTIVEAWYPRVVPLTKDVDEFGREAVVGGFHRVLVGAAFPEGPAVTPVEEDAEDS